MFKMFRNELNRLFKMPLILIFGIIILGLTLLSTLFYSPTNLIKQEDTWNNKTSLEIYTIFNENSDYKSNYDSKLEEAQAILNYYTTLNGRSFESQRCLNNVLKAYNELKEEIPHGDSPTLVEKYIQFQNSLLAFKQTLLNFSTIQDISYIKFIINSDEYSNSLSKLTDLIEQCEHYYNTFLDKAEASNAIVNFYGENQCEESLKSINLSSMAFLDITINNLIEKISIAYQKYITYIETVPNSSTFEKSGYEVAENHRLNLRNLINGSQSISKLLEYMIDTPYLSVYSNKNVVTKLQEDLNRAYTAINFKESNNKYYISHRNAVMLLKNIDLITSLQDFQKDYILILPDQEIVKDLSQLINNNAIESKFQILNNINQCKYLDDTENIIDEINKYKAITEISYKLVVYESVLNTADNLSIEKQSNFYGENLESYNAYEFQSLSTLYRYYLEYPDTLNNYSYPLEFNLSSGMEENKGAELIVYMLRIATILTLMALVVVAVIILPYEWQTRTIRLTLARPISRTSILFGKLLALFTLGTIYLSLSFVLSLIYTSVIGLGISSTAILTVFNATKVIKISPVVNIIIIFISHILEILFVISLILMICTIFRKSSLATIFSYLALGAIYFTNWITNASIACSFLPNTNINFYKYFLASSNVDISNLFTKLFTTPVCLNANFVISILIYIAYLLIFYIISNAVMKCRDF